MPIIIPENYESTDLSGYPTQYQDREFQTSIEMMLFDGEGNPSDRYFDVTPLSYEEFREVPDFPDYYISTYGRVKSVHRSTLDYKEERILRPLNISKGYAKVTLCNAERGRYKREIHYFMRLTYFPDAKLPQMNHIDEVKYNNCIWNLHPCTAKFNNNYGTHTARARHTFLYGGGLEKMRESMKNGGMEKWKESMKNGGEKKRIESLRNGGAARGVKTRISNGKSATVTCINSKTGESKFFETSSECARYLNTIYPDAYYRTIVAALSNIRTGYIKKKMYRDFEIKY